MSPDLILPGLLLLGLVTVIALVWLAMREQRYQRPRNSYYGKPRRTVGNSQYGVGLTIAIVLMLLLSVGQTVSRFAVNTPQQTTKRQQIRQGVLPPAAPGVPIGGSLAVVEFRNASPSPMILQFDGAESQRLVVERCETCRVYQVTDEVPKTCPDGLPAGIVTLQPGLYKVKMKITSTYELVGDRTLLAGMKYRDCWHLVQDGY